MKTYLLLQNQQKQELPELFRGDDVRYPEALVEYFLSEYTKSGDVVLDPFMGYGTTLRVAQRMGRVAYGIEYISSRCDYVRSTLQDPSTALPGDSRQLQHLNIPPIDFSMTSPPYMGKDHTENPFTGYSTVGGGYKAYLNDLREIYRQIGTLMKLGSHAVIEVSNLKHEDGSITTLAWDIAQSVSHVLKYLGEIVVCWQPTYAYGYDHSYCLVFGART